MSGLNCYINDGLKGSGCGAAAFLIRDYDASAFLPIPVLHALYDLIENHGDCTQNDNGSDHHIKLEEIESVRERDRHGENFMVRGGFGVIVYWRKKNLRKQETFLKIIG